MTGKSLFYSEDIIAAPCPANADIQRIAARMIASGHWEEVVPGMADITVKFDPDLLAPDEACQHFEQILGAGEKDCAVAPQPPITLSARCDDEYAPDAAMVCNALGIAADKLHDWLSHRTYRVAMMGFQPGFAYLEDIGGGILPVIPRLASPRQRIAAGSIGILGNRACIYALDGPGGWPIIGRITERLFNKSEEDNPFLLSPGQEIRFETASPAPDRGDR
ncbi:MAG: carboxyltransferase domain-containing protein [Sphingorhabdus sp.]